MIITRGLVTLLFLVSMSACTPVSTLHNAGSDSTASTVNTITAIDVRKRGPLASIVPELVKHQIVLVGESHTSYGDHQNQLAVINALHPSWSKMGIGLEFIQSPYQKVLDEYIAGSLSDAEMLKKTEWYERWKYDFRLYRDIFHYAKSNKIPLFALNAPKELTKKISKKGIAGLAPKDRRYLPKHLTRSKAYKERLLKVFRRHSHSSKKKLDNFVDVQLAWDESMALNAAKAINSGRINKMVLLAGSGHVIRQGIPVRLEKRLATKPIIIVNQFEEDLSQIDFVLQSKHKELPPAGKIGIMMEATSTNKGVTVVETLKTHKGGLKKGDVVLSIDGNVISNPSDVKISLLDKKKGESVQMEIQRGNTITNQSIKLH